MFAPSISYATQLTEIYWEFILHCLDQTQYGHLVYKHSISELLYNFIALYMKMPSSQYIKQNSFNVYPVYWMNNKMNRMNNKKCKVSKLRLIFGDFIDHSHIGFLAEI